MDSAIYVKGKRVASSASPEETYENCRQRGGVAWIGLYEPTAEELDSVAGEFGLHELAVEDALKAHQRPKLERYGNLIFVVLKPARYVDEGETVEFGEIYAFVGPDFVITVRHGKVSSLSGVRARIEGEPELLQQGPMTILYAILDHVVDGYAPVVEGLEDDIDEIEVEVFGGSSQVSRRIYELSREVIQFRRAIQPLSGMLRRLIEDEDLGMDSEIRRYLRDVHDHVLRANDQVEGFRELLSNILNVNLTLVGIDQNDKAKKISAWAAILFIPTLITGVYGMNFQHMPELNWTFGYPFALFLMVVLGAVIYLSFKRAGWL